MASQVGELIRQHDLNLQALNGNSEDSFIPLPFDLGNFGPPPTNTSADLLGQIPRQTSFYTSLGTVLIEHPRLPNMFLLEYRNLCGAWGYQTCGPAIDLSGIFDTLRALEKSAHHDFKVARAWACTVQAVHGLPQEVRWILATIYEFANLLLRLDVGNDASDRGRAWLTYYYEVADRLFTWFSVPTTTPRAGHFPRPDTSVLDPDNVGVGEGQAFAK